MMVIRFLEGLLYAVIGFFLGLVGVVGFSFYILMKFMWIMFLAVLAYAVVGHKENK